MKKVFTVTFRAANGFTRVFLVRASNPASALAIAVKVANKQLIKPKFVSMEYEGDLDN